MTDENHAERRQRVIASCMDAFNSRDMDALGALLTDDVSLVDWEVVAHGKADVLATTRKIVSSADLKITVRQVITDGPRAVADLAISINGTTTLEVLDLFEFSPDGTIASIRAFKGPET